MEKQTTEEILETTTDNTASSFLLKERFEICFDTPLPELDSNGAKAFEVKDNVNPNRNLFALICGKELSPRLSYLPYMKSIDAPNILKLVEYGIVNDDNNIESMTLIYNKPTGPKANTFDEMTQKLTPEIFKSLALSLLSACDVLKTFGLTHRAIRLDNLFFKDSSRSELVLGDCLASFPSFFQPLPYETIENALCEPQSRGNGFFEHDLYSSGVALLGLSLGKNIHSDLSSGEQIRQKLKNSSFTFLSNNEKIHNQISMILRSLLDDNSENRCDYTHLINYYEGKTTSFTSSDSFDRSNRALIVNGEKCYTRKSAALTMLSNPDFGIEVIQSGKLLEWVKTGLEDEKLYAKIEKQISAEKDQPDKSLLLTRICIYLDHTLPLKTSEGYLFPKWNSQNYLL